MNDVQQRDKMAPAATARRAEDSVRNPDPATPPPDPTPTRRAPRRLWSVGPTLLIGAGVVLLLNTLGVVPWGVWALIGRLWPVALIAVGLDILVGRRSARGSLLVAGVTLAALCGGVWLLAATATPAGRETIAQGLAGASRAEIAIGPGVAELRLAAADDAGILVAGTVDRARGEALEQDYRGDGGVARYTLQSRQQRGSRLPVAINDREPIWDLRLAREVPLALTVNGGVGRTTLDLTGLRVTGLRVEAGVGGTTITLPTEGRFAATIDAGIGAIVVQLPAGLAARVRVDTGIGNVTMPGGYMRDGEWYVSPGYADAPNRVELAIQGGIGRITVAELAAR